VVEVIVQVNLVFSGPPSHQWRSAMQGEHDKLNTYGVYKSLEELQCKKTTVDIKWPLCKT
jgi:hypothetical protein